MMDWIEYERGQEMAAMGEAMQMNLEAIFEEWCADNVHDLYRTIYKCYDCGPWLSVQTHDGVWHDSDDLEGIEPGNVRCLKIGSIVEGSPAEIEADPIDLINYDDVAKAVQAFNDALVWVNGEAAAV